MNVARAEPPEAITASKASAQLLVWSGSRSCCDCRFDESGGLTEEETMSDPVVTMLSPKRASLWTEIHRAIYIASLAGR